MMQAFRLSAALLAFFAVAGAADTTSAESLNTETLQVPGPVLVDAATSIDKVALLTALAKIESDVTLGVLFVHDGREDLAAVHFAAPRAETIPDLAATLQSLGLVDFEARFADLETATGKEGVRVAVKKARRELSKARLKIKPTAIEKVMSIAEHLRAAAAKVNPNGPTEVEDFQDVWGMVMVAREHVDLFARGKDLTLLGRTPDPALINGAQTLAGLVDLVLIDPPDPAVPVPTGIVPEALNAIIVATSGLTG